MKYYISDLHFNDEFILQVCKRPFSSVSEMNEAIIRGWNRKVKGSDEVFILGDIFPCKPKDGDAQQTIDFVKTLNGSKTLVIGNHDESFIGEIAEAGVFAGICRMKRIVDGGQEIILCHYPLMSWQNDDRENVHFYGHMHNKDLPEISNYYKDKKAYNCGCDIIGFAPKGAAEITGGRKNAHND